MRDLLKKLRGSDKDEKSGSSEGETPEGGAPAAAETFKATADKAGDEIETAEADRTAVDPGDGDSADGDSAEGDSAEGDSTDGDSTEGDSTEGESAERESAVSIPDRPVAAAGGGDQVTANPTNSVKPGEESAAETTAQSTVESESASGEGEEKAPVEVFDSPEMRPPQAIDATIPMRVPLDETAIGQPLGELKVMMDKSPGLVAAQKCHIGNVRARNEDSSYIFTTEAGGQEPLLPFGLYVVADGMGGHHAGHDASRRVSRIVAQQVLERIYLPVLNSSIDATGKPHEPVREVMLDAVQSANRMIHSPDPDRDSGTTLSAALVFGRRLYVAHVGDSRVYLLADGKLKSVTTDHSYVQRLQDAGQLTEEEAAVHPQRNMLYKAVGQGGELEIDTFTQSLPKKGKLLLCSDGLWGLVPDTVMQEILEKKISLEEMTDQLVDLARQAGGHDNITAIVVSFDF